MFRQIVNLRTVLALIAIFIVTGTIFYSRYLARKIAAEEKLKVEQWVAAGKFILTSPPDADTRLASMILLENKSIPIIETNERDEPTGSWVNLDSNRLVKDTNYLRKKIKKFRNIHNPIEWSDPKNPALRNKFYYGDSLLLDEVRYYPIVQLAIVALFILITIFSLRSNYRSVQNQLWTGMAKETAHQLGTPVSSLEGWVEMLRDKPGNEKIAQELEKDVNRLRLVSDRFGKIGSTPQLEPVNLVSQINSMVDYMRKRAAGKIILKVNSYGKDNVTASVSPPLFDWVVENLLKNALDAMEGKGSITADIQEDDKKIYIDITDTGKGISKQNVQMVFKPGFTTKKRGWGLGLSLSKRIIEQFHKGEIFVKNSEIGKGTTFRIVLKK
jgi:signal transduction histidine kinase